jgi:replicative DNA helicase
MSEDFTALSQMLPPQNLEAEESILGGILLDPEAMGRIADLLIPAAFYDTLNRHIYEAAIALHRQGRPTDLMTVSSWLQDHELLDKIGGTAKLAQLVERTVSAVNIDRYALLVMDKFVRRRLIGASYDVAGFAYDTTQELEKVLDRAEQAIFAITQERPQAGLVRLSETLIHTFDELESLQEKSAIPGLECGFYDLDSMTSGLQRSDLIILAGRPSMGKTALGLNIAANLARLHQLPIAIFSLEMSKEQLAQRLLAAEANIESNRLRTGNITTTEMEDLANAIGTLCDLPIYIDDTAMLTVTQMRSQVRRLQAEQGSLGLVLLDYLQLMEGGSDNRVQELSKITRSLKGLAREVNAPVIALSQLSRGVESRTNKRPMMSDLRECVTGDTLVWLADGRRLPLADLVGQTPEVISMDEGHRWVNAQATRVWEVGQKPIYQVKLASGRTLKATAQHRLFTFSGWQPIEALKIGDHLAIANHWASPCDVVKSYATTLESLEVEKMAKPPLLWDEIVALEAVGCESVYDLTVPITNSWLANGIVSHNSGSIEQDADLILMLYRDIYYNPDSPDRNAAEVIIAKHRNGPTGTVKLLFQPELTKFENLAQ